MSDEQQPEASTAPNAPPPDPGYNLLPGEQMGFASMNLQVMNAKLVVYSLNAALEKALQEVDRTQAQFSGALGFLANAHGMGQAKLTPDFSKLEPSK